MLYSLNGANTTTLLCPPKPKLLEMPAVICRCTTACMASDRSIEMHTTKAPLNNVANRRAALDLNVGHEILEDEVQLLQWPER